MKRYGVLYIAVFVLAFGMGNIMNATPKYRCRFEPYIVEERADKTKEVAAKGGIVNINTAGIGEFMSLYGIGEKLAERIVKYREESGMFEVIEDVMKVPGIGEKKFEKIKENIRVE